jgi:hypothetical protein
MCPSPVIVGAGTNKGTTNSNAGVRISFRIPPNQGRGDQHKRLQQIEGEHCPRHYRSGTRRMAIFHRAGRRVQVRGAVRVTPRKASTPNACVRAGSVRQHVPAGTRIVLFARNFSARPPPLKR